MNHQVKFMAEKPHTEKQIKKFIEGVINTDLPVYKKTQKSGKNKLTRSNL